MFYFSPISLACLPVSSPSRNLLSYIIADFACQQTHFCIAPQIFYNLFLIIYFSFSGCYVILFPKTISYDTYRHSLFRKGDDRHEQHQKHQHKKLTCPDNSRLNKRFRNHHFSCPGQSV